MVHTPDRTSVKQSTGSEIQFDRREFKTLKASPLVLYEYPFNESIRTMLRLEHLFDRLGQLARETAVRPQCDRNDLRDHGSGVACRSQVGSAGIWSDRKRSSTAIRANPSISRKPWTRFVSKIDHAFAS